METKGMLFDSARRFEAILGAAARLRLPGDARVLDAGGYPCLFAREARARHPGWRVTTVDTVDAELDGYRKASGTSLPFADAGFDLVVSSDTLEHIPAPDRAKFVSELLRVCAGACILGAPFDQPATRRIEGALNSFHAELTGRAHPWLGEHIEHGLPVLEETLRLFPPGRVQALMRSAPLADWTRWHWNWLMRETWGALDEVWCKLDQSRLPPSTADYALAGEPGERRFLSYRWLIISQDARNAPLPAADVLQALRAEERETTEVLALSEWMEAIARQLCGAARSRRDGLPAEIDARLKTALAAAEQHAAQLQAECEQLKKEAGTSSARKARRGGWFG